MLSWVRNGKVAELAGTVSETASKTSRQLTDYASATATSLAGAASDTASSVTKQVGDLAAGAASSVSASVTHFASEAAATASVHAAAVKSAASQGVVAGVGKTAEVVSLAAGTGIDVLDEGVARASRPVAKITSLVAGGTLSLAAGAGFALGAITLPVALGVAAVGFAGGWLLGKMLTRAGADVLVGGKLQTTKNVADWVVTGAKVLNRPAKSPAESQKERPAA